MEPLKKITAIRTEAVTDESPDLSHLGEYVQSARVDSGQEYRIVDRAARGDVKRGEFEFFIADNVENEEQAIENYERMEQYNNSEWCMYGIRAVCTFQVSHDDGKTWNVHTLKTPGLWSIESDSEESYMREVGREQLEELQKDMEALGFGSIEFAQKCQPYERTATPEIH